MCHGSLSLSLCGKAKYPSDARVTRYLATAFTTHVIARRPLSRASRRTYALLFSSSIVSGEDWQRIVRTASLISRKSYFPIRSANGRISTAEKPFADADSLAHLLTRSLARARTSTKRVLHFPSCPRDRQSRFHSRVTAWATFV